MDERIIVGVCKICGEDIIFDMPVPEAKKHGYHGCYMCGCTTVCSGEFPDYWVMR
ncbi:MAG: hypothetical protein ACP5T9_03130 [Thermoplasmata archaeon]